MTVGPVSKAAYAELRDADGNAIALPNGSITPVSQGALLVGAQFEGEAVGFRAGRVGSQAVALGNLLFWEDCEGATLNSARWTSSVSTMTATQSAGGIFLNAGANAAAGTYAIITSVRQFARKMNVPLDLSLRARVSAVSNSIAEFGLGAPVGVTATIANSAHWRVAGANATPVLTDNSAEIVGSGVDLTAYAAQFLDYGVTVEDYTITYTVKHSATGGLISRQELRLPSTQAKIWQVTHLPVFARVFNATAPASAPVLLVASVSLVQLDELTSIPAAHAQAGTNLGGEMVPTTGLQVTTFANSTAPASATLSNTAAGYATLGGLFQFAAVAGAATDYALFGFQVPAPYTFFCTGIHIGVWNTGAAVATTPTLLVWGVMSNSAAVSLATAAPRVALGSQSLPVGAVPGADVPDLDIPFETPIMTGAGRYLDVILRMPVATATASQILAGCVSVRGYYA
jgi:hypothetical protein